MHFRAKCYEGEIGVGAADITGEDDVLWYNVLVDPLHFPVIIRGATQYQGRRKNNRE